MCSDIFAVIANETKKWVKFGTRRLEILSIADRRERGVLMEILCKEVVDQDG